MNLFLELIAHGSNVNAINNDGNTALIWAARKGLLDIAKGLLKNGASVNHKNIYGFSAIIYASEHGFKDMVMELASNGANINDSNNTNEIGMKGFLDKNQ